MAGSDNATIISSPAGQLIGRAASKCDDLKSVLLAVQPIKFI